MNQNVTRLVAVALVAGAILVALVIATGGGSAGPSGSSAPPAAPTAAPAPPTQPAVAGAVKGTVRVQARHLHGSTWQFVYTVRNTGKVPIAGFQLNAARSNLFTIRGLTDWTFFGGGVCGGPQPTVLIYWSTGAVVGSTIAPNGSGQFSFQVNTSGPAPVGFSLSYQTATPFFGTVQGPRPSTLKASGPCK
jgi:hypothetical protein